MWARVWIPVIVVFLLVLIFASLRLSSSQYAKRAASAAMQTNPDLALSIMQRVSGPPTDEQDKPTTKKP